MDINPNFGSNSGARLSSNDNEMEDERQQLFDPVLTAETNNYFKPLKTIPIFSVHLLISTIISFVGVILAAVWSENKRCEAYFIMLYLRAAFWAITFIFDHFVKHHHEVSRLNGHLEFHRQTSVHRSLPLYIVSLWNTIILIIETLMQHYYGPNFIKYCVQGFFSPITYITGFCLTETVVLMAVNGSYIGRIYKFNKSAPAPDALKNNQLGTGSVGLLQPGGNISELLEKQADLISYLKEHNLKLNQKLMQLNSQLRNTPMMQSN